MSKVTLGGRPADISSEGGNVRIVFHPVVKGAKHPDAKVFQVLLSKSDLETIKKVF